MEHMPTKNKGFSFEQLTENILLVDQSMRGIACKAINQSVTLRNWIIGGYIVEYEQNGKDRAEYGERIIDNLSDRLKVNGLNKTLLKNSRAFYNCYSSIGEYLQKSPTALDFSRTEERQGIPVIGTIVPIEHLILIRPTLSGEFTTPAEKLISRLSFSHIVELLTIDDPMVRFFYETE